MSNWKKIGHLKDFKKGNQWLVFIEKRPIALFRYQEDYYAIKNGCLHQGFSLAEGNVNSYMVECPLHGWVYDFRDGKCLSLVDKITTSYSVRIKDGQLEINYE